MVCNNCGNQLETGETKCANCGAVVEKNTQINADDNSKENKKPIWKGLIAGEVILLILLFLVSTGSLFNKTSSVTDKDSFISIMKDMNYYTDNNPAGLEEGMHDSLIATGDNVYIDFVIADSEEDAIIVLNDYLEHISNLYLSHYGKNSLSISFNHYVKQSVDINGNSYVAIRKNNIVIFGQAPVEQKKELNKAIAGLGYGNSTVSLISLWSFALIISCISFIILWKIFKKAGINCWYILIPFYNLYLLNKIIFGKGLYMLLLWAPLVNIVFIIISLYKIAKVFGKSNAFAVGNIFFSFILLQIIAFDDSKYIKQFN